ncbi:MAG: orotate phosphoribosyltransferase [Actinomycetaceae bacterium]
MTSTPASPVNDSQRARLAEYVSELGVVRGHVVLSSGKESDYYVDMRRVTLHREAAPLLGHVLLDLLEEEGLGVDEIDAVGGLTLGADPVALSILHAAASRGQSLDAFVVRKEAKAHGMQRRIEGPDVTGRRVVVVEDTSTTGGSALTAVHAVLEAGAEVAGVLVVLDRATGAREAVEEQGHRYLSALELSDIGLA